MDFQRKCRAGEKMGFVGLSTVKVFLFLYQSN